MVSPVPKHLRTRKEIASIRASLRGHVVDIELPKVPKTKGVSRHRAKFAPGLSTRLVELASSKSIGDPMAGTETLARETGLPIALNDIDKGMRTFLNPLRKQGCEISYGPASAISWKRDVCVFSPPYYPRTDRRKQNAHDDAKRGAVVGFRTGYDCDAPGFIGNPEGVDGIKVYRQQMLDVYNHMTRVCDRMIVVVKNWMRLGVELRLDLDTILTAEEAGWMIVARHGFEPPPSLWARYNKQRGGMVTVEDILIFDRN